jgi:hypothetical protein
MPVGERTPTEAPGPRVEGNAEALARGPATRTPEARTEVRLGGAVPDPTARGAPRAMGRSHDGSKRMAIPVADVGPTVTATLRPSARQQYEVAVIEGRPPKTVEVPADDRSRRRYCLAGWVQSGRSADYTYLCRV